ncbi:LRR receptor-like serine/threonine-protein kinase GHR1 [Nicotiana tomentosiformis]|uniref:LRR receptor-like serine/threonine-protein kinase GHR1 n=1 Tax=Nicotiana tomentosiformis TaxID=4098 RepID=UPI00051B3626|nr:LRR receptor-like serine/threonine-protein kinase GHR1 [Nicotiana tomentosiformis]
MQSAICLVLLFLVELVKGSLDLDVLLELKKGVLKDPLGKVLSSWDSKSLGPNGCPKNWYGISCSDGHVTSIELNDVGLVGALDFAAIAGLKMLQNLSVANNQLSGKITKEVGLIVSLEYLDLSKNLFSGSIPSELTSLKNLVSLNLSLNSLDGMVPSGFASLEKLKYLDLHSNALSSDIMLLLASLGDVEYVDISSNKFIGSLDLQVGNSSFVSSIQYLNISHNNLAGELFPHDGMPYFDSLEVFDASDNQLTGIIPSFNFVVSLRILRLGNNQLSGSVPEALLEESSMILSELDLSQNQLAGPIASISAVNLKLLNLSYNQLSGPLPVKVGRCAIIDLSNNLLTGKVSRIQGWGNYAEVIVLSSNTLTGTFPNQTSQFLRLTSLKISNNSLEGVLPAILGTYPELKMIDLSINQLSGTLLPSLFNSSRLTDINVSFNKFTGSIPIVAFKSENLSLISLDLSHNELSGLLPPGLGKFPDMVYLDISNNDFEGGLPSDLSDKLEYFNVSNNNLSGTVPKNLWRFPISSFQPGNPLLVLPKHVEAPSEGDSTLNLRSHGPRMKSTIRAALIAGLVCSVSVIALLTLVIYRKAHQRDGGKDDTKVTKGKKGLSLSDIKNGHDTRDQGMPVSTVQNEPISSSISVMSSANLSPSKVQDQSKSPNSLRVSSPDKLAGDLHLLDNSLKFTAEELSCAPAEAVGRSCHGTLYKAMLGSGQEFAVKWLKEGIVKGKKEFAREAKKLGSIRHPNLVSLQGYYWGPKEHERLLISNYTNAPCLALYLLGKDADSYKLQPLSFEERLEVSVDVARCLNYLHHESAIPHGNLKSTNVLIETPNVNALLTDYSLHRLMTSAGTAEQVLNAGALGYRPPEFASTSKPCPSLKSDVYAFGVILLELLTGRSSAEIVPGNSEVLDLTEWVRLLAIKNRSIECFDPFLLGKESNEGVHAILDSMLQVALKCILPADERPDMRMVFEELCSIVQ